jgi:hypothetical protein
MLHRLFPAMAHQMTASIVVMAIAVVSAIVGLTCTVASGVSMFREYAKRIAASAPPRRRHRRHAVPSSAAGGTAPIRSH